MINNNKKYAFVIALIIPIICYYILKFKTDSQTFVPNHFIYDTVIENTVRGKIVNDTQWHVLKNISIVNQLNDTVQLHQLKDKILILDFIFTRCGGICPALTTNMRKLQESFLKGGTSRNKIDTPLIYFLSFSIDPNYDKPQVLKKFADKYNAQHKNWWFLTGSKQVIYDFIFEDLKVDKYNDEPISPDFAHTSRMVLIDKHFNIRGYYNGLDQESLKKLVKDIGILIVEKDSNKPSSLAQSFVNLKWILALVVVGIIIFLWRFKNF